MSMLGAFTASRVLMGGLVHKPLKFTRTRKAAWVKRQQQMAEVDEFLAKHDRVPYHKLEWPLPPRPTQGRRPLQALL